LILALSWHNTGTINYKIYLKTDLAKIINVYLID